MSTLWLSALFAALVVLLVLGSVRLDWLRIWWRDQLEHPPGAANDSIADFDVGEDLPVAQRDPLPPRQTAAR